MDLQQASSWFNTTPVDGWDGSAWVSSVATLTLLPFDRFISERAFGLKRRYALLDPSSTSLETYPVIRFETGEVYLVGMRNFDIQPDPYSQVYLLHRAPYTADLVEFETDTAASGMATSPTRSTYSTVFADVDRMTSNRSREFDGIHFSDVEITLPRNAVIGTENEIVIGTDYYDVREVYSESGFIGCRALRKKSA